MPKTENSFEVKVLRTEGYLRILDEEKKITFAVFVGDQESHHQISVLEFDTREKIELRMAEIGAQVATELSSSDNAKRTSPLPVDIQALVDDNSFVMTEKGAREVTEVVEVKK